MEKQYLETLLAQIREKRAKEYVRQEIAGHIADQKACYIADGMSNDQAEEKAVADMGDPVETGIALDQIHRPKPAWGMLAMIAVLCAAGVLLQFAVYRYGPDAQAGRYLFESQLQYAVFGYFLLCGIYLADYTKLAKYSRHLCTGILILLSLTAFCDLPISFDRLLSLNILFYLYLPLYGAVLYSYRNCKGKKLWYLFLYTILPVYLASQLAYASVRINLAVILFIMLGTAVHKGWFPQPAAKIKYILFTCVAAAFLLYTLFLNNYQHIRIQAWLNPAAFSAEEGYLQGVIRSLLHNSRLIGQNTSKLSAYDSLPNYATDYILSYMIATFGILAAAVLILFVVLLGAWLLRLSIRQKNQLGMAMGLGCSLAFVVQSAEYILVNLALLPASSLYFPLISFGGSNMLQTCVLLGILLSIYRYENVAPEPAPYTAI
ncbi:MAG: FtsW/RodA/SpoVE family cell cycle protein [Eubacterium sp.]|nr:FtsW/RodA/SpoVE family cell cycle protein [Eubacterium sp.]